MTGLRLTEWSVLMNTITDQVDNYIENLQRAIYQPIVERDAGHAPIARQKAALLLLPLLNGEQWTDDMQKAALAVGAVHAAFDAHDQVDIADASSKKQQLIVLAGDHFSGIHYKLLASIPDFELIRSLSEAIARINEAKTILLQSPPQSIADRLELIGEVEGACIKEFFRAFGFSSYYEPIEPLLPLLFIERQYAKFPELLTEEWLQELQQQAEKQLHNCPFLHSELKQHLFELSTGKSLQKEGDTQ